jgi:hypothetical protein
MSMLPASESKQASPANTIFQQFVTPHLSAAADALGAKIGPESGAMPEIMAKRIIEMASRCGV